MITQPLLNEERLNVPGATHRVIVKHSDLTTATASTTQTLTLATVAASQFCTLIETQLKVPFEDEADADNNSTLCKVGDSADDDRYMVDTELNVNGTEVLQSPGTFAYKAFTAADAIAAVFTPVATKNLAALTKGEVWFYLKITDARFPNV